MYLKTFAVPNSDRIPRSGVADSFEEFLAEQLLAIGGRMLFFQALLLEDHHGIVEIHAGCGAGEFGRGKLAAAVIRIQQVDVVFAALDERIWLAKSPFVLRPIGGMQIFDHVDRILWKFGIQKIKRAVDM